MEDPVASETRAAGCERHVGCMVSGLEEILNSPVTPALRALCYAAVSDLVLPCALPVARPVEQAEQVLDTADKIGGVPFLEPGKAWPASGDGTLFQFFMQFDLAKLPQPVQEQIGFNSGLFQVWMDPELQGYEPDDDYYHVRIVPAQVVAAGQGQGVGAMPDRPATFSDFPAQVITGWLERYDMPSATEDEDEAHVRVPFGRAQWIISKIGQALPVSSQPGAAQATVTGAEALAWARLFLENEPEQYEAVLRALGLDEEPDNEAQAGLPEMDEEQTALFEAVHGEEELELLDSMADVMCDEVSAESGEKVGGYVRWCQGVEYFDRDCCLLQMEGALMQPFIFGDCGTGAVMTSRGDAESLGLCWACH